MQMRWLAMVLMANLGGCGETCAVGESTCSGNGIRVCGGETGDQFAVLGPDCGEDRCIDLVDGDGLRHGVCTTTGEPDSRCGGTIYGGTCVDATTWVVCDEGYSYAETTCGAACIDGEVGGGFCAVDPDPSPRCDENGETCEPGAVIRCFDGYVTDRIACGTSACAIASEPLYLGDHLSYCVGDAACAGTDVRCNDDLRGTSGCVDGRVVAMSCNPGTECRQYTVNPMSPEDQWRTQAECYPRR